MCVVERNPSEGNVASATDVREVMIILIRTHPNSIMCRPISNEYLVSGVIIKTILDMRYASVVGLNLTAECGSDYLSPLSQKRKFQWRLTFNTLPCDVSK